MTVSHVSSELEESRRRHFGVLALNEELQTRAARLQKLLQVRRGLLQRSLARNKGLE